MYLFYLIIFKYKIYIKIYKIYKIYKEYTKYINIKNNILLY